MGELELPCCLRDLMKIQIFSDIHNNLAALERAISTPADLYISAGDLVTWAKGLPQCGRVLQSLGEDLPADQRAALEAVMARDETGPKVGDVPPDFSLKRLGSSERIRLSSFKDRQPVALAFGSYT